MLRNASIGDTFIINIDLENEPKDTFEIIQCSFQTRVTNGQICDYLGCYNVVDFQDTIDAAMNIRLDINTPESQTRIELYPTQQKAILKLPIQMQSTSPMSTFLML